MRYIWFITIAVLAFDGCKKTSEYSLMEARELASDQRSDSLFFGIYLGMPAQDFYARCWELNRKGKIRQGASNTSVYYEIPDFKEPAGMDFYPRFFEDKIIEMPLVFTYKAWSPWNKSLFADSLKVEVLDLMEQWYGHGFIEVKDPKSLSGKSWVKVDDNRKISIYNLDDSKVYVDILDLRLVKSMEKAL